MTVINLQISPRFRSWFVDRKRGLICRLMTSGMSTAQYSPHRMIITNYEKSLFYLWGDWDKNMKMRSEIISRRLKWIPPPLWILTGHFISFTHVCKPPLRRGFVFLIQVVHHGLYHVGSTAKFPFISLLSCCDLWTEHSRIFWQRNEYYVFKMSENKLNSLLGLLLIKHFPISYCVLQTNNMTYIFRT